MFKIDQFTAANEAAIDQFNQFAQLSLANLERVAQLGLGAARSPVPVTCTRSSRSTPPRSSPS